MRAQILTTYLEFHLGIVYRSLTIVCVLLLLGACGGSGSDSDTPAAGAILVAASEGAGTQPMAGGNAATPATQTAGPAALVETVAGNGASGGETSPPEPLPPVPDTPARPAAVAKMYINTEGGAEVVDKEEYLSATVRIESDVATERMTVATEIRGRGNATWGFPKKPYRLKLGKASSILGMPAEKDWALLANYVDKTLARNKLAMTLGTRMGMDWTSRSRFVELYMNDEYRGVYEVFEHVKTGKDRVNVESLDRKVDIDPQTISGGWLLEIDKRKGEEVFSRSSFRGEVFQRWCALKRDNTIGGIGAMIDGIAATIGAEPVARNFQRWPTLGVAMTPFFNTRETTYQGEIDYLKNWLGQRVAWIDGEYSAEFGACPAQ